MRDLQTCSEDKEVRWFNAAHESILGVKWFTMALKQQKQNEQLNNESDKKGEI